MRHYEAPGDGAVLPVLDGVSLEVHEGESVAIVGPSGSGKSTLLHIIGTLDRPDAGQVLLGGRDLARLTDAEVATVRNRHIGFVFQAHYLLPQCTVLENVLVPTLADSWSAPVPGRSNAETHLPSSQHHNSEKPAGRCDSEASAAQRLSEIAAAPGGGRTSARESVAGRAERLLARVGLAERMAHRPGQLSGGERQRVAVVRALINQPRLVLADEPTGSLDQASAAELARLLADLNREEGVTLIIVTHARDLARKMNRVLELKNGRLGPVEGASE